MAWEVESEEPAGGGWEVDQEWVVAEDPPPAPKRGFFDRLKSMVTSDAPLGDTSAEMTAAADQINNPMPSAPRGGSILDQPAPGYVPSRADLIEQSKSPEARLREAAAARIPVRGEAREVPQSWFAEILRKGDAKPLDQSLGGAVLETATDATRGLAKVGPGAARALYGGIEAIADVTGLDGVARWAALSSQAGGDYLAQFDNPNGDRLVTGAFQSLGQAAAGGAIGGPTGAVALMVGQTAGDKYSELREAGIDVPAALEGSAVHALGEFIGERSGMRSLGRLVAGLASKTGLPAREALKEAVKQQGEEQVTLAIQSAYDKLGSGSLRNDMTLDDYVDDVIDTVKSTAIMTAAAGAGGRLARAAPAAGRAVAEHFGARPVEAPVPLPAPTMDAGNVAPGPVGAGVMPGEIIAVTPGGAIITGSPDGMELERPFESVKVENQPTTVVTPAEILSAPVAESPQQPATEAKIDVSDPAAVLAELGLGRSPAAGGVPPPAGGGRPDDGGSPGAAVVAAGRVPAAGPVGVAAPAAGGAEGQPVADGRGRAAPVASPDGQAAAGPALPDAAAEADRAVIEQLAASFRSARERLSASASPSDRARATELPDDLTPARDPSVAAQFRAMSRATSEVFGTPGLLAVESDAPFDGFDYLGRQAVNVKSLDAPAPFVAWHEVTHDLQNRAARGEADAVRIWAPVHDAIYEMIPEAARRDYAERYLFRRRLAQHNKGRAAAGAAPMTIDELLADPAAANELKREMVADFGGKRAMDREFINSLAKREPKLFGEFAKRWIALLGELVAKLRGQRELGVKDVDKAIADLQRAKLLWADAMIAWRKRGGEDAAAEAPQKAEPKRMTIEEAADAEWEVDEETYIEEPALQYSRAQADADGWAVFPESSGSLGIPRAEMPQVKLNKRPELFAFLKNNGIESRLEEVDARGLKPSQAEYQPSKVESAKKLLPGHEAPGGVLLSSDGYVVDGHHRWLAAAEMGDKVSVTRLDAPARQVIGTIWRFPGTYIDTSSEGAVVPARELPKLTAAREKTINDFAAQARELVPGDVVDKAVAEVRRFAEVPKPLLPEADRARIERVIAPKIEQAARDNPGFVAQIEAIAEAIGATPKTAPVKSLKRSIEKSYEDELLTGQQTTSDHLKDLVRGSVVVSDPSKVDAAIAAIKDRMNVIRIKDRFSLPLPTGYRDVLMNVELETGTIGEVQVHVPAMVAAKDLGHLLYEIERNLPAGPDAKRLSQAQKELYAAAWGVDSASTSLAKTSSVTGDPSRITRPTEAGAPVTAETASSAPGSKTTGMPPTSTSTEPSGRALQSYATATSDRAGSISLSVNQDAEAVEADDAAMGAAREQPAFPRSLDEAAALDKAMKVARGKSWRKGRDLKAALQTAVIRAAREAGVNPRVRSPQAIEYLTRVGVRDVLEAIKANENAVGWYDLKTRQALAVVSLIHPEIATDENARLAFVWALAVTSNGLKVDKNFELAERAYRHYKRNGSMPTNLTAGQAQKAINESLGLFDTLRKEWGIDNLRRFMLTNFTVGEIGAINPDLKPGGEHVDVTVKGASILGPKIGNGFFSNLYGSFDALTMDRWLIRTWGRWTGTLLSKQKANTEVARQRLRDAISAVAASPADQLRLSRVLGKLVGANTPPEQLAPLIAKASMDPEDRAEMNRSPAGVELRLAGNGLAKYLDGQKEAPGGPHERKYIREVFGRILSEIRQQPEHAGLTMADLQAVMWYAEKRLYEVAKTEDEAETDGYEDDEAPDYANAAAAVARARNVPEAKIKAALAAEESKSGRPADARLPAGQEPAQGQGQPGQAGGFAEGERAGFLAAQRDARTLREERAKPKRARVIFEVAPDPNNEALSGAWRALPAERRLEISRRVARAFAPRVLETVDNGGIFIDQVGSYLDDTNQSMAVMLTRSGNAVEVAQLLGFVLSQDSMVVVSPKPLRGATETGAVVIEVGEKTPAEIDEIYQRLRQIKIGGENPIGGQSTVNGQMVVLNFSNVPTGELSDAVNKALGNQYNVVDHQVYAAFPSKQEYDYADPQSDPRGNRGLVRQRARDLRAEAQQALERELRDSGVSFSRRLEDDLEGQQRFLEQRAQELGYASIEEFAEKDFEGFNAAANEWRVERPAEALLSRRQGPAPEKTAAGSRGAIGEANPGLSTIFPWRDDAGRFSFAPTAAIYDAVAPVVSSVLAKVGMNPMPRELKRQVRKMKGQLDQAQTVAKTVAGESFKMSEDDRKLVSDIVENELKAGVIPPAHAVRMAQGIQRIMEQQSNELLRLGMLSQETVDRHRGTYLPRFYVSKLRQAITDPWAAAVSRLTRKPGVMQGIKGKSLKGRGMWETVPVGEMQDWIDQGWEVRDPDYDPATSTDVQVWRDFTRDEREKMGEIRDAGFRFTMGYMQTQRDIALGRMFEGIAANRELASKKEKPGWVQVPDGTIPGTGVRRYGKLAGMWVPPEVMSHLANYDDGGNEALRLYRKALSAWKEGKTVLNPVSHANNVLSNVTMAHFAGVSYWDAHKYAGAIMDLTLKRPMVEEARKAGLFQGTMTQEELLATMPPELRAMASISESKAEKAAGKLWDMLSLWMRRPAGTAYEAEDLFFRYVIYRDARARGMSPDDAVDYSQRYLFTYDDLPKTARRIRDYGLPFFAYTYKAIPALLHTAAYYPHRMLAPAMLFSGMNMLAYALAAGEDDEDWEERLLKFIEDPARRAKADEMQADEAKSLPPWMRGNTALMTPKAIRLGLDEMTGLPMFLDTARIVPGGDMFDIHGNAGGVPWLQPFTPSHPLLTSYAAMFNNKDSFFGKEIVDSNDTTEEAFNKRAEWLWRQFTPAIAYGNYHSERLANAVAQITGEPVRWIPWSDKDATGFGRDGLPVQPKLAALQTVGIKVRPVDLEMSRDIEESQRKQMIRAIDSEIRRLRRLSQKGAISDRQLEIETERAQVKKERLRQGLTVDGEERK